MNYYLAIDIGASSGRHILSWMQDNIMKTEEIYRFKNQQLHKDGHDIWDMEHLWNSILMGLKKCLEINKIPISIGIDTWAVDFVLIDKSGKPVCDPVSYRDSRTATIRESIEPILPFEKHYERTGIQYQPFNTVYQLLALKKEAPTQLAKAEHLLMIPDYLSYLLTGTIMQEYTNATSTALVDVKTRDWDYELMDILKLPKHIFSLIKEPGTLVGKLQESVANEVGFHCNVVLPATHDTASAFLAVPCFTNDAIYLSSGTWSLIGVINDTPITSHDSMTKNFTNEGGYDGNYRFLKNVMGLWMVQCVQRELNGESYILNKDMSNSNKHNYTFAELCELAEAHKLFPSVIDIDKERFLSPSSMISEIEKECEETGQIVPNNIGELMYCIYHSLAIKYKLIVDEISEITGKEYQKLYIVGGGSNADYLNALCARETKMTVYAGPSEATAIGNLSVQMLANKELCDITEVKQKIVHSFKGKEFTYEPI